MALSRMHAAGRDLRLFLTEGRPYMDGARLASWELRQAGIERADAFAAVSSGDNSNIISARLARETFGVVRVAARIYDQRRAQVYERLGIPTVATVRRAILMSWSASLAALSRSSRRALS